MWKLYEILHIVNTIECSIHGIIHFIVYYVIMADEKILTQVDNRYQTETDT